MTCPFDITVATNSIRLNAKRQGEAAFTIFNRSGRPVRGRAQLAPQDTNTSAWLTLVGDVERSFAIAETVQYGVQLHIPDNANAGNYAFRLDMVGVENPDEDYCAGPSVTFAVPEPVPVKPFPWKWVIVAVVALLVVGVGAFLLWPREISTPHLGNLTVNDARATLEAMRLAQGALIEGDGGAIEPGRVFATTPGPNTPVARNSAIDLVVAAAPTDTPIPPPTNTPTSEPTDTPIPEPTDTPTPTPTATPTPTPTRQLLYREAKWQGVFITANQENADFFCQTQGHQSAESFARTFDHRLETPPICWSLPGTFEACERYLTNVLCRD